MQTVALPTRKILTPVSKSMANPNTNAIIQANFFIYPSRDMLELIF